jgi:Recombination endonuclease VII
MRLCPYCQQSLPDDFDPSQAKPPANAPRPCLGCGRLVKQPRDRGRRRKWCDDPDCVRLRRQPSGIGQQYNRLTASQRARIRDEAGKCAICHGTVWLQVDHDHETGEIRGVLCGSCNGLVGALERVNEAGLLAGAARAYLAASKYPQKDSGTWLEEIQ